MLLMSGTLLSSMYDEAFTAKDNCWGLLYGSRTSRVVSSISDAREETSKVDNHISITAYESFRVPSAFDDAGSILKTLPPHDEVVGTLLLKRDGLKNPSFRDIIATRQMLEKHRKENFPFLILVLSVQSEQMSWIYSMSHSLYCIDNGSSTTIESLELRINSLSSTVSSYAGAPSLHTPEAIRNLMSPSARQLLQTSSSSSIVSSVELEALAASVIDDIKLRSEEIIELEQEIATLRAKLHGLSS